MKILFHPSHPEKILKWAWMIRFIIPQLWTFLLMMMSFSRWLSWPSCRLSHMVWFLLSFTPWGVRMLFLILVSCLKVFTIKIPLGISSGWNFQINHMFFKIFWMKAWERLFFHEFFPKDNLIRGSSQANVTRWTKTSASWEATHAYPNHLLIFLISNK